MHIKFDSENFLPESYAKKIGIEIYVQIYLSLSLRF